MPYATPLQYTQRFGLEEATQLLQDEESLLTSALLKDAIAGTFTGTPNAQQIAAANAALARLTRQLAITSNFMDGYLRSAMTLPLSPTDANIATLEDCCTALARCGLADDSDNATDRMDKCCADWRKWLLDIQAGRAQLIDPTGNPPTSAGRVRQGQAASNIPWGSFGGVR